MTKLLLIFPPGVFSNDSPPSGIPTLASYLKSKKYKVNIWDLNQDFTKFYYQQFFQSSHVSACISSIKTLQKKNYLTQTEAEAYHKLITYLSTSRLFAHRIPNYSYLSLSQFNYEVEPENFISTLKTKPETLFHYPYFQNHLLTETLNFKANIIGFSISCIDQLYPSLILASLIKKTSPKTKIVFGGSFIFFLDKKIIKQVFAQNWVDYFITLQGEKPFELLLEALNNKIKPEDVPNLIYPKTNKILETPLCIPEHINNLPWADYSGLNLQSYENQKYVCITVHTGCYWNKCVFCDFRYGYGMMYKHPCAKDITLLIKEINHVINDLKIDTIWLLSEAIPAHHMKKICEAIIKAKIQANFMCFIRSEKGWDLETCKLMKKAGIELVRIGIENFSDRILKLINKGNTKKEALFTLKNMHLADINSRIGFIYDFPTITEKEMQENLNILKKHIAEIYFFNVFPIYVNRLSVIGQKPAEFGISINWDKAKYQTGVAATSLPFTRTKGADDATVQAYFPKFLEIRDKIIPEEQRKIMKKRLLALNKKNSPHYWLSLVNSIIPVKSHYKLNHEAQAFSGNLFYYIFIHAQNQFIELTPFQYDFFEFIFAEDIIKLGKIPNKFRFKTILEVLNLLFNYNCINDLWIKSYKSYYKDKNNAPV